jgi:hypothetical protein
MTVQEFREMIDGEAAKRMDLAAFADYVKKKSRPDKYLKEEYLPMLAVIRYKGITDTATIELGDEKQPWDARVNGTDLYEVIQALPENEHEIRKATAGEARTTLPIDVPAGGKEKRKPVTPVTAQMVLHIQHAGDHLQYLGVVIDAIKQKHEKRYTDDRTLVVAVDGDYTAEDDAVIERWLTAIRQQTDRGTFKEVLLIDVARLKAFKVF